MTNQLTHSEIQNSIPFFSGQHDIKEVLRISRDGVWANPDIPVDDAAKLVLTALDAGIKHMVAKAVEEAEQKFMDNLIAHPAICRQIIDAGLLASNPAGFKERSK